VDLAKRGVQQGQLWFTMPGGWRVAVARAHGRDHRFRMAQGCCVVSVTLRGRAMGEVDFEREAMPANPSNPDSE
jgi:hypothetical protein